MMITCLFQLYLVSKGGLWVRPDDEDDDKRMEDFLDTAAASTLFGKVVRNRLTGITGDIR